MSRKVKRSLRIELNNTDPTTNIVLGYLTYHAGKLWNEANYLVKNKLVKPNKYDLYNKLKDTSIHKKALQSRTAQIVLDELSRGWQNFFKYLQKPEKYPSPVKPPKYNKKKSPHRPVIYDKTGFTIEGNTIRLSLSKELKNHLKEKHGIDIDYLRIETGLDLSQLNILNIQIAPYKAYGNITYRLNIVYEKEIGKTKPQTDRALAIDYGVSNFATVVIENQPTSYIVDGKGIQSILRKYLKKLAKWQKKRDNLLNKGLLTSRVDKILHRIQKRINNLIRDFSHKVSNLIVELAKRYNVSTIVIGKLQESKNKESKLSSIIDQMLSLLPHGRVSKQIEYKAKEYGIKTILVDESYTSGVDSLINQTVSKENYTPEARKHRGLFKSVLGFVNADVNGARNILKKFKKSFHDCITGLKRTIRIRVFGKLKSSPKTVRVYGQIGVARCGDHLSGIRLSHDSNLPEKPPTNLRFEHAVRHSNLVGA
ncbi:transposase [Persephonella sp.]|uniref:RNA-guided endonuclease InsQ/TnpB family protein n=1 Tax=Persephonella sp. TaxID=2060922 RepID=UPI0025FDAC82|nr:transposase [Persephonella sp.]